MDEAIFHEGHAPSGTLPPLPSSSRRGCLRRLLLAGGIGLLGFLFLRGAACSCRSCSIRKRDVAAPVEEVPLPRGPLGGLVFPTAQSNLLDASAENVFMPTVSGRRESALYGSTRKARDGRPSFHEGIDIAPLRRQRSGRALDEVVAIADGRVGYINPHSGNSNYGIYVVLYHDDPLGEIYTLYAHLASVAAGLSAGQAVPSGTVLGRMGNTPPHIVPVARSHLHLEIGVILNRRFDAWLREQKMPAIHGNAHGWNLLGIDPLAVYAAQRELKEDFTLYTHIASIPSAWALVVRADHLPDYFQRYPSLWEGPRDHYRGPALVMDLSEGGVPLRGRPATKDEAAALGNQTATVRFVNPEILGGNGRRLIRQRGQDWSVSESGRKWLAWFLYE